MSQSVTSWNEPHTKINGKPCISEKIEVITLFYTLIQAKHRGSNNWNHNFFSFGWPNQAGFTIHSALSPQYRTRDQALVRDTLIFTQMQMLLKGATSRISHLEKNWQVFSSLSFVIHLNLP